MKKSFIVLPLLLATSLTACEDFKYEYVGTYDKPLLLFNTVVSFEAKIENGKQVQ